MGRHKVTLTALPGVEYDSDDQSLWIDIAHYRADQLTGDPKATVSSAFLDVYHLWRKLMPAYPVRVYHVRGDS